MSNRAKYNQALDRVAANFQELREIVLSIKEDFKIEHDQDPYLTVKIVDHHLDLIEKYLNRYDGKSMQDTGWSLGKDLSSDRQNLSSFFREFDNPFLKSEKWYQRIVQLLDDLQIEAKHIDDLILANRDSWIT